MIDDLKIENILELIDPKKIRVYQPTRIIFICGGKTDVTATSPTSLRDAFMRVAYSSDFEKYQPMLAEELDAFFPKGDYKDFLSLESDIAQISTLVLLFSESFGSAAELGAFAMVHEISHKILVVIDDKRYGENSFIKLGPIRAIENANGDGAICVVNHGDLGIEEISDLSNLDTKFFSKLLKDAIAFRQKKIPEHSSFNPSYSGHMIKLIVGLIQWYGALTVDEIETALYCLDASCTVARINDYLLCAEFAKWIVAHKRGVQTFFVAMPTDNVAVQFSPKAEKKMLGRVRWQAEVRAYWKEHDILRFRAISDVMKDA
ncbi:retron St85 family effector protein [Agrobacterium salinitolerans]|uniref:DUF4062 domain-containing protein n=1 Tax=Agrobacterium salinitolerans TaxID=1183413 RepID=A0ABY3BPW2_9HYPH|nr:retron St85 family effector protein [Agrobacterium salinitolerans]MCZ7891036.1 retron St85 family effector protein [Agrobacterium salinitolerans]TRA93240.1 hypothetical protein EXN23_11195 [Agrobacterium salinitolerans]